MLLPSVISIASLPQTVFLWLLSRAVTLGTPHEMAPHKGNRSIGMWFQLTSTRTRVSFGVGANRLGANCIFLGPQDLQTNTGESVEDTARVLGCFLDALVVRAAMSNAQLSALSDLARIPVINAMSYDEHPTQAIADLSALLGRLGTLDGVHLVYVGEGNSTAVALALAVSRIRGMRATFVTPTEHGLPQNVIERAESMRERFGGCIETTNDFAVVDTADAVYATRWVTTGTQKRDANWRGRFDGFSVSAALFEKLARGQSTVFMHDLPAVRGEDCDANVIDGPHSIVLHQASQKLAAATAVLEWCLGERSYRAWTS